MVAIPIDRHTQTDRQTDRQIKTTEIAMRYFVQANLSGQDLLTHTHKKFNENHYFQVFYVRLSKLHNLDEISLAYGYNSI